MTISDSQLTQLLLTLAGIGGFLRLRWQRNEDRREKIENAAQLRADAQTARQQQLEDMVARRKEEAEARAQASQERRDATVEIIAKAEAEAKAMKILTEATAEKLRIEAVTVAQRLADQNKREYVLSTALIEQKIAGIQQTAAAAFQRQDEKLTEAIDVANHSNQKIIELQQVLVGHQDAAKLKLAADGGKLDKLQATADTIDGKVDAIVGEHDTTLTPAAGGKLDRLQDTADTIDAKVDTIVQKDVA